MHLKIKNILFRVLPFAIVAALVALVIVQVQAQKQLHATHASSLVVTNSDDSGDQALASQNTPVFLSVADQQLLTQKQQLADAYALSISGQQPTATVQHQWLSVNGASIPLTSLASCPPTCSRSANQVPMTQESQVNKFYCGPAAVEEVLLALNAKRGPRGEWLSAGPYPAYGQHVLAENYYLQTDAFIGTNWGSGVVPRTLNAWYKRHYYVAINGTNLGGYFSLTTFEHDLILDVDSGHPLMGGVRMDPTPTRPHLIGFPTNQLHYHWIAINGYAQYGAQTQYADSVHGDTQYWWWASHVPAFSTIPTASVMFPLLNTFGYVW